MNTLLNASQIRETTSLVKLLKCLGFSPAKRLGADLFYVSMLDDADVPYSFVVNEDCNLWYDHSLGRGGNAVDFIMLFWKPISYQDALIKIHIALGLPGSEKLISNNKQMLTEPGMKEKAVYQTLFVQDAGTTGALTYFLEKQFNGSDFSGDLKEVYFQKKGNGMDDADGWRTYYGLGWQNECGGWEVRNKYFRTCVGHKGVTFIPGSRKSLVVFSDYFSYLSWKGQLALPQTDSVLVLNHHELIFAALAIARRFKDVQLYMDRSHAGFKSTRILMQHFPDAKDCSTSYAGHLTLHAHLRSARSQSSKASV